MTSEPVGGSPLEVLVMAGGEGRRLGLLTSSTPKPMLPVCGRPVLQHILERLRDQGVQHSYLSVRHLSHVICDYFGDGRWLGIDIDYLVEDEPLGTAGAIGLLPATSKPVLVLNGDVVTPVPVDALAAHHHRFGAAATVGSVEERVTVPYGVIECGGPDVLRLREKPELVFTVMAGVNVIGPEVVAAVPRGVALEMPDLVAAAMARGRVVEYRLPGPWLDIGTPDHYARADEVATLGAVLVLPRPALAAHSAAVARRGERAMSAMEVST